MRYHTTMKKEPNRSPNTRCDQCGNPIYRRPSTLARNAGKFCSRACRNQAHPSTGPRPSAARRGAKNPAWKGGRYIEPEKGYVLIRSPDHPRARVNGYVLEHIVVAEMTLGRSLRPGEEVHHVNHNRADNRPDNLKVYENHLQHWMTEHYEDVARARDAASSEKNLKDSRQD